MQSTRGDFSRGKLTMAACFFAVCGQTDGLLHVRSEPNVGVPVTSGKTDDAGRLGTSILKLEPGGTYITWRTRQDSHAANTEITALNIYYVLDFFDNKFEALNTVKSSRTQRE